VHNEDRMGVRFWTAWPAGRTTDWISSELMRRVTSEVEILARGRLGPLAFDQLDADRLT